MVPSKHELAYLCDVQSLSVIERFLPYQFIIDRMEPLVCLGGLDFNQAEYVVSALKFYRIEIDRMYRTVPFNELAVCLKKVDFLISKIETDPRLNPKV